MVTTGLPIKPMGGPGASPALTRQPVPPAPGHGNPDALAQECANAMRGGSVEAQLVVAWICAVRRIATMRIQE